MSMRNRSLGAVLALGLASAACGGGGGGGSSAGPVEVDAAFGTAGRVVLAAPSTGTSVLIEPDDGVLLAGGEGAGADLYVRRYTPGGLPDATWAGGAGVASIDLGGSEAATSLARLPGGKVLVGGTSDAFGTGSDFVVVRLHGTGLVDPSFGDQGVARVDFGADEAVAKVLVQADGRILLVGNRGTDATDDVAVARLTEDGDLDATFHDVPSPTADDGDGRLTFSFVPAPAESEDVATSASLDGEGRLLVAGAAASPVGSPTDVAAARVTTAGTLDGTFSGDGVATFDMGTADALVGGVHPASLGRIWLVATEVLLGFVPQVVVHRLTDAGDLDPTFHDVPTPTAGDGDGRRRILTSNAATAALASLRLADDSLVLALFTSDGIPPTGGDDVGLLRMTSSGALDPLFADVDGSGVATILTRTDVTARDDGALAIARDAADRIVLGGTSYADDAPLDTSAFLLRYGP